ncbi:hypothetical protein AS189_05140 [Arthrobacter alpinus]|uniref:N-acetyltransferase domain-containing protein n=1 Tax=Arthrobacter alpinus TaxID=656366 RepID=A0A0S2M4A4_9MICC|nr:hypothetical protein AS189_05140 [Arthrobacter alpinus]
MRFSIRQASAADAPALAELAALTFPLACPPSSPKAEISAFVQAHLGPDTFAAYLADPLRVIFVAEDKAPLSSDRLLAYTMLVDTPPADADVAVLVSAPDAIEFSKCYAHPDTHGHGVGTSIMAASLDWIASQGRQQTWLGVNSENERAQKFYRKHGFAVVGTRSFQLGKQIEHDYVMVRSD